MTAVQKSGSAKSVESSSQIDRDSISVTPDEGRVLELLGLGGRIALARQKKGWTQKELSERLGKSRGTVIQYEQGGIEPPLRQILAMSKLLDVTPELLAFGRQGIRGLGQDTADVASLPEVTVVGADETISGAYGLPGGLLADLGIDRDRAKIFVLGHAASAFGLAAGDRIFVNLDTRLDEEDALYALRTRRGVDVVRVLPRLSRRDETVMVSDGTGETRSYEQDELEVLGRIVGAIRAA